MPMHEEFIFPPIFHGPAGVDPITTFYIQKLKNQFECHLVDG